MPKHTSEESEVQPPPLPAKYVAPPLLSAVTLELNYGTKLPVESGTKFVLKKVRVVNGFYKAGGSSQLKCIINENDQDKLLQFEEETFKFMKNKEELNMCDLMQISIVKDETKYVPSKHVAFKFNASVFAMRGNDRVPVTKIFKTGRELKDGTKILMAEHKDEYELHCTWMGGWTMEENSKMAPSAGCSVIIDRLIKC
jgi:hypothetical protein